MVDLGAFSRGLDRREGAFEAPLSIVSGFGTPFSTLRSPRVAVVCLRVVVVDCVAHRGAVTEILKRARKAKSEFVGDLREFVVEQEG